MKKSALITIIVIAIIIIVAIFMFNSNKNSNNSNNTSDNSINNNLKEIEQLDISKQIQAILTNEKIKQANNNIAISFNDLMIDENNNITLTMNCTEKLDFKRQQDVILSLADSFFTELPEIYGKGSVNKPKIKITSGANCIYREGWQISNGYLGALLV